MDIKAVGIVGVCLLMAVLPASAQVANFLTLTFVPPATTPAKPHAAPGKRQPAAKQHAAAVHDASAPATDQTGTVDRHKAEHNERTSHAQGDSGAYAALPEAYRAGIQSDLALLVDFGDYDGVPVGNFDDHLIDAIKAFQKRNGGKETGILTDQERALLAAAVKARQDAIGWRLIDDTATGARLGLPATLVPKASTGRSGSRWTSGQGQVQVETFRLHEAALPALFEEEKRTPRQREVKYSALKANSFVIAGEQKLKKFVVRAQASGSEVRGITILYDQATEGTMDRIAVAITNAFQGFPDPTAAPPPGSRRSVEYGTAVMVSSRGHLIAPRQATDECQTITVPGFGHADRIAEDQTNDLALLRLYGARNLIAAPLAGESGKTDTLTLFGIADPLAQAGDGKVTSAAAHVGAQGVEPAPQLGFSGAAAVDTQGRFAGVVELKPPVIAGAGTEGQQAALIPADAVRAFLAAQGIAPAAGHAAMNQSVVRIICVRN